MFQQTEENIQQIERCCIAICIYIDVGEVCWETQRGQSKV